MTDKVRFFHKNVSSFRDCTNSKIQPILFFPFCVHSKDCSVEVVTSVYRVQNRE